MLNEDYRDMLHALSDEKVKFLLVGKAKKNKFSGSLSLVVFPSPSAMFFTEAMKCEASLILKGA